MIGSTFEPSVARTEGEAEEPTAIEPWAVVALAAWLAITFGWWALALWPLPGTSPEWLARARVVCFNATETGLPDPSGWLLLFGQPIGMLGVLVVGWPRAVRSTLRGMAARPAGRVALSSCSTLVAVGLLAAGIRVARAEAATEVRIRPDAAHPAATAPGRTEAAAISLLDQNGVRTTLARFRGRPVLLTFAFGHCETVCPVVVRNARLVRDELPADRRPVLLVITLDPWRDRPSRLGYLAGAWELGEDGYALGGTVAEVNRTLDDWGIERSRDPRTGDIVHAATVVGLDAAGLVVFESTGELESLRRLVDRLHVGERVSD